MLTTPFTAAIAVVIYVDLRVRKEAFDLQLLAGQLGVDPPEGLSTTYAPLLPADPPSGSQPPFWPPPPGWTPDPPSPKPDQQASEQPPFWPPPPGSKPGGGSPPPEPRE
jgi:hypothetical protein